ncbi:uroporphyrinogen-III synthase [Yoonia sp. SDW83-1]|uniref:uroporphyrinogen-III synthase n=1 Tax=Yoonia sp. SDW83-1 TaxID=3366945 RepID=UPI00398C3EB2
MLKQWSPTLIITRPLPQGKAFAQALRAAWDGDLQIILSPLVQIVPLPVEVPQVSGLIFTSANGVAQAARLNLPAGLPAWCVGDRTAEAATEAGFAAKAGPGNAAELITTIVAACPTGPLAHIRGRHARGDVAAKLTKAGIACADLVAYDQAPQPLSAAAMRALSGEKPVVLPLFSPRTVTILSDQGPFTAPLHIVAISDAALPDLSAASVHIAAGPTGDAMLAATIAALSALVGDNR